MLRKSVIYGGGGDFFFFCLLTLFLKSVFIRGKAHNAPLTSERSETGVLS